MTGKQQAFINQYLITLNATEAARLAGYQGDNTTLAAVGYENLRKPQIAAEIQARMRKAAISADETLARISQQATGSMADFLTFTHEGSVQLDLVKAHQAGKLGLIKKFTEMEVTRTTGDGEATTNRRTTVELYAADAALDRLMRYHGLYNDKVVHTWKEEVLNLLRDGRVTREEVIDELGADLAEELFKFAGIPTTTGRET